MSEAADAEQFVTRLFNGMRYGDTDLDASDRFPLAALTDSAFDPDTFLSSPLNTAFFTRDPLSVIGSGISLNHMYWHDRNREVDLLQTVAEHHPCFADTPQWFGHDSSFHLEGGDIVNLSGHAVAIGLSSRTESLAIDRLSQGLLWGDGSSVTDVYVIEVPQSGNRLHLDAYLSPIDGDTFVVDPLLAREPASTACGGPGGGAACASSPVARASLVSWRRPREAARCGSSTSATAAALWPSSTATEQRASCPLRPATSACARRISPPTRRSSMRGMTVHPVSIQEMTVGFGGPNSLCLPLVREDL